MKRLFDIVVSVILFITLMVPMCIVAWLVRCKLGSPIIFPQERPGLHGKPFKMYKFRTMTDARDAQGQLLSDAERLTQFGKWLRATSLDELPELWNVLLGDMSLVGPRPLLMQYLPLYNTHQARRHEVRPGITGWAQVNGRNAISWEQKFNLDVWYVEQCQGRRSGSSPSKSSIRNGSSLFGFSIVWLDIKILCLTALKVLKKDGVNTADQTTMPLFKGSNHNPKNLK